MGEAQPNQYRLGLCRTRWFSRIAAHSCILTREPNRAEASHELGRASVIASSFVTWLNRPVYYLLACALATGCVPRDGEDGTDGSPSGRAAKTSLVPRWRPRPGALGLSKAHSSTSQTDSSESPEELAPQLSTVFRDDFQRTELGPNWHGTTPRWAIEGGKLCGQSARNHPVWLKHRLAVNARIEYTARTLSDEGDIKVEAWGSGQSFANGASYNDATSYLLIFGGWKNQLHVLARLNEHGSDRLALPLDPAAIDVKRATVKANHDYAFIIERKDGRTVTFQVDGEMLFAMSDTEPLTGRLHEHFGFNDWETHVCFDNLVVTPLSE